MTDFILQFEQVSYRYPPAIRASIDDLNLKVPVGKRCALIGQNGCGKTTLFLLACGLLQPQQGTLHWQGERFRYDRRSLSQLRQQIGLVFQNPEHQVVAATVEEDISYGLCNLDLAESEIADRVKTAIDQFNLSTLANQPIHTLSLGQKKRVSIADVMVLAPKLLLLDEPTAYLDPRHTCELIDQLQRIHAAGTTILMATHDLDFVYGWADWVFVMNEGRLVLEGTPEAVFAQRDILESLQLGVPMAIDLVEQIWTLAQTESLEAVQQQILRIVQTNSRSF